VKFESAGEIVPVRDDEVEVIDHEAPPWFRAFEARMSSHLSKLSTKLDEVKQIAQAAKYESSMAKAVADEAQERVKDLATTFEEIRDDFVTKGQVEDMIRSQFSGPRPMNPGNVSGAGDDDEHRDAQIIAHGFDTDTDAEIIEKTLNDLIKEMKLEQRVSRVFTFSDPASIGVIEFQSIPSKKGFYKKLKQHTAEAPHGNKLSFGDNKTLEQRIKDKHLGFMKHFLIEDHSLPATDVKIKWPNMTVEVKGKMVAWFGSDQMFCVDGLGSGLKEKIEAKIKEWSEKRQQ